MHYWPKHGYKRFDSRIQTINRHQINRHLHFKNWLWKKGIMTVRSVYKFFNQPNGFELLALCSGCRADADSCVDINGTTSDFIEFSFDKYQIIIFPFYSPPIHTQAQHTCTFHTYLARACQISCPVLFWSQLFSLANKILN